MAKFRAQGTTVTIAGQAIGGIINIGTPDETKGVAETTDTDSGGDRTFINGLRDAGEMTLECRWDPDDQGQKDLDTEYEANNAAVEFIVSLPAGATTASGSSTLTFDGLVVGRSADLDTIADETANRSYTIKVTGGVTIA